MHPYLKVRSAKLKDAEFLVKSIHALAEFEQLGPECKTNSDLIKDTFFCATPKVFALIAEINNTPVGIAIYFYNYSTFLGVHGIYLEDLFVWPEHRKRGVGLSLFRALAQKAHSEGLGRIDWAVLDWNQPAIDFYSSLKASAQSEWTVFRLDKSSITLLAQETN